MKGSFMRRRREAACRGDEDEEDGGEGQKENAGNEQSKAPSGGLQLALRAGFLNRSASAVNPVLPELRGLRKGMAVRVCGLKAAPEFNGQDGVCVRWDTGRGRWQVRLRSGPVKVLKPENVEELYSWSVHNGYISHGDVILRERMTIEEAIVKCSSLPECRGFCFAGGLTDDSVEIVFKSKWDIVPEGRGWLSYQRLATESEANEDETFRAELLKQKLAREEEERARAEAEEARKKARQAKEEARSKVEEEAAARRRQREALHQREEAARQRPDHGQPTCVFEVGDLCEVVNGIIVRRTEDLESQQMRQLPNKAQVEVVEIGTGPTGKRVLIRDRYKREGWVSVVSSAGVPLLRLVKRQQPAENVEEAKDVDIMMEVDADDAPFYLDMLQARLEEEGFETFDPRYFIMVDADGDTYVLDEPLPLETISWPLHLRYYLPQEREPVEIPVQYKGLPFSSLGAWRPDALPVSSLASMLVSSVFERMHYNRERETNALAIQDGGPQSESSRPRFALPWDSTACQSEAPLALEDVPRLGALERSFRSAVAQGDQKAIQTVVKKVEDLGMMPDVIRQHLVNSWRGPLGYEPFEHKGKLYTMRSIDKAVFDKDLNFPVAMWNPHQKRAEPVKGYEPGNEHQTIKFFGKTFHLMPRGELVDPAEELIVGAYNPETMLIETIDPVPIKWKEFMDTRGFRIESGSSSSSSRPFIQVLGPKHASLFGQSRDEVASSVELKGWKMLKNAESKIRGDRDLVLQTLKQGASTGSWQVLLHSPQEICRDREVVLEAVKQDPDALLLADETLRKDHDLVLVAVKCHALALRHADESLRNDRFLVLEAIRQSWRALGAASEELRGDRELVLEAVRQSWQALEFASEAARADPAVLREAVARSWRALTLAPEGARAEAELALAAIRQSPQALQYIGNALLEDREFVLEVVRMHGQALKYASAALRGDREVVVAAVAQTWHALRWASPALRGDREIVRAAVLQDWQVLSFASEELLSDSALLLEAARKSPEALQLASGRLRGDRAFMLEAVQLQGLALRFATVELREDAEVVKAAAANDLQALQYASDALRSDRHFMLPMIRISGGALAYASEELRGDQELVAEAAEQDWGLLRHASAALRADRDFMLRAVRLHGLALAHAAPELLADRPLALAATRRAGLALGHAAEELRADPELVLEAVRQDWEALAFAPQALRADREFVLAAVRSSGQALRHASEEFREDEELVLDAVRSDWRALRHAGRDLRADRLFLQRVVQVDPLALAFASEDLRNDSELVTQAMEASQQPPDRPQLGQGPGKGLGRLGAAGPVRRPGPPPQAFAAGSFMPGLLGASPSFGISAGGMDVRRPGMRSNTRIPF